MSADFLRHTVYFKLITLAAFLLVEHAFMTYLLLVYACKNQRLLSVKESLL